MNDFSLHNRTPHNAIKPDNTAWEDNRPKDEYKSSSAQLDSSTTSRREYTAKDAERMKPFKPEGAGYRSDALFDNNTAHKVDFKKWDVQVILFCEPITSIISRILISEDIRVFFFKELKIKTCELKQNLNYLTKK
jgi:hypothetical protein